ncbi:hypothetical protein K8I61_06290 [bacterium]|nr:hypothetical protein [bacterium]
MAGKRDLPVVHEVEDNFHHLPRVLGEHGIPGQILLHEKQRDDKRQYAHDDEQKPDDPDSARADRLGAPYRD